MKSIYISIISAPLLLTAITSTANAASFNGAYVGVQGGYENYHENDIFTGAGPLAGTTASGSGSISGAVGGIYGGYGQTYGKFYFGIEAQGDLSSVDESTTSSGITTESKQTYSYGVSVRPGYLPTDNLLIYTRLGWIASHFEQNNSGLLTGGTSFTPSGIDTGLGVEYALSSNITARLDWTYASYQKVDITTYVNGVNLGTDVTNSLNSNTFRAGLAYNF